MTGRFAFGLLILWFCAAVASIVDPYDYKVWATEMLMFFTIVVLLSATYRKLQFSKTSYFIIFCFLLVQTVGAHYTFERVPFFFNAAGRNNFDRFGHFVFGLNAFVVIEFLLKRKIASSFNLACVSAFFAVLVLSNTWRFFELFYADIENGKSGDALLGMQGDYWDAQKDMLCDITGSAAAVYLFKTGQHFRKKKQTAASAEL